MSDIVRFGGRSPHWQYEGDEKGALGQLTTGSSVKDAESRD